MPTSRKPAQRRFVRTVCALIGLLALAASAAVAAEAVAIDGREGLLRLKVYADAEGRDWLSAQGYDIAGHALAEGWVEVIADAAGAETLRGAGFGVEVLEARRGPRPPSPSPLGATTCSEPNNIHCYANPAEVEAFLMQTVSDHPSITRLVDLGTTEQGRTIWGLMISDNAAVDEDELAVLFSGAHHAREIMTPEVVMDTIDRLTDNYGIDPVLTAHVDNYQIWCVPIVNPDGVNIVHTTDDLWRKNARDNNNNSIVDNQDGVDLNRNYEWGWGFQCGGSSGTINQQTYRGPSEGSEPETRAMIGLGRQIRPVFDVEYHSHGEDVFYAMSCDPTLFNPTLSTISTGPNQQISRVVAEAYAAEIIQADGGSGFAVAPFGSRVDGTGRDHQFHENGALAYVTEVNNTSEGGFHPDFNTYRDDTVAGQRPGWLWLLDRVNGPAIGGRVLDAVTGSPVEADVALDEMTLPDGKRLTSRPDTGRFHIIVVPGDYTLRVSAPGYQDATVLLTVGAAWSPSDINLQPLGSSLIVADDLEDAGTPAAWIVGAPGDGATTGVWTWGSPHGTHTGNAILANLEFGNPRLDATPGSGTQAFVTGNTQGINSAPPPFSLDDVSGGATTLTSPSFDLSGWYAVQVSWQRWFRNDPADPADLLEAEVSTDGGSVWLPLETLTQSSATADASPAWVGTSVRLDDIAAPGNDVRLRFRASDTGTGHVVEAAVDDLRFDGYSLEVQGQISGVRLSGGPSTVLDWDVVSGAADAVYDVARGNIANLTAGVNLGPLTCIEENSADTSTSGSPDGGTPLVGQAFFYVVRFNLGGNSVGEWGRGSGNGLRQGSGGCSP